MKRRVRVQPDQDQLVVVESGESTPLLFVRDTTGITCRGDWTQGTETTRPPAASIVLLESGRVLCRTIELPNADEAQLETAMRLQVDTQQLGSIPEWRTSHVILPIPPKGASRHGFVVEWPDVDASPAIARDLPPDGEPLFAPDASSLAALLSAGAAGPLVNIAADRTSLTFAFATPSAKVIRCARLDKSNWIASAETTVLESALHAGMDAATMASLLQSLREALERSGAGGFGCTAQDLAVLTPLLADSFDFEWWKLHGLSVGAAMAWFGPLRPLVALRAQPQGTRPGLIGEFVNRVSEPIMLAKLVAACLLAIAVAPPTIAGARLLLLQWKIGDLSEREQSIQDHRQRLAMYDELQRRVWPMGKLLGDLACVTPLGIEWDDISLSQDRNVVIRGIAKSDGGLTGIEAILAMERQMRDSRVFDRIQKKWDSPDSKGSVDFSLSAAVTRAIYRPNYSAAQDFGKKSLRDRRYPPEPVGNEEPAETPTELPPAVSLPEEPSLADLPVAPVPTESKASIAEPSTPDQNKETPAAETEKETPPDGGKSRGVRRGSSSTSGSVPRRSDHTPGSGDSSVSIPAPLTDAQIEAMSRPELLEAVARVSKARQQGVIDPETEKRLKSEFEKLMLRIRSSGS